MSPDGKVLRERQVTRPTIAERRTCRNSKKRVRFAKKRGDPKFGYFRRQFEIIYCNPNYFVEKGCADQLSGSIVVVA